MMGVLVFAGCASTSQTQPTEAPDPLEAADTAPAPQQPPPEPPAFDSAGNPYVPGTMRVLGRTLYFDYDSADIKASDLRALELHARVLRNNRDRQVLIEGHCDERGTREYNLALGEGRANSVQTFLTSAGVFASQIETVSYGEERPEDPGHNEDAWSRNRRALLIYR
tara:strand:+ start:1379 stop:1879 length:501 start_codon:yes stop_codon:yes gene_type:complete